MRRIVIYVIAILFLIGGVMGIIKAINPQLDWLSFRYLLGMGATFNHQDYPLYARVYGAIMAIMEIFIAGILLLWRRKYFFICLMVLTVNMAGCLVAVLLGDLLAGLSLLLRIVPILLIRKEMQEPVRTDSIENNKKTGKN